MKKIVVAVLCIGQVAMVNGMRGDFVSFHPKADPLFKHTVDGQPRQSQRGDNPEGNGDLLRDGQLRRPSSSGDTSSRTGGPGSESGRVNPFSGLGPVDSGQTIIGGGDVDRTDMSPEEIAKLDSTGNMVTFGRGEKQSKFKDFDRKGEVENKKFDSQIESLNAHIVRLLKSSGSKPTYDPVHKQVLELILRLRILELDRAIFRLDYLKDTTGLYTMRENFSDRKKELEKELNELNSNPPKKKGFWSKRIDD